LQEIIQKIKRGDKNAFRMLVEKYQQQAFRLAFRMLGDEDEARDVVQESFIKIWEKFNTYNDKEKFSNWMYRIVSNRAIDSIRAQKRRPLISLENLIPETLSTEENGVDIILENREAGELIRSITSGLPEKQQLVFSLRDLEGFSQKEVQEISGLAEDTIKSNLYHARKTIREKLVATMAYERSGS
jgi:RNA polymerase sigma-70 factor (ECF subfamily)